MATGNVILIDEDGNIGSTAATENSEQISGLLFDISAQTGFWTTGKGAELAARLKDQIIELHSLQDAKDLGLTAYTGAGEDNAALLMGIPYYHINHFFTLTNNYSKTLYLYFADCSNNWEAIVDMQKAANGQIGQFGVWTERKLWKETSADAEEYKLQIVDELQTIGNTLANVYNAPASIILNANVAQIDGATAADQVALSSLPSAYVDARYVTVALGQEATNEVHAMQGGLTSKTPVGNIGLALGLLTRSNVAYSIGYVNDCNLRSVISTDIEFGFGNAALTADKTLTNPTPYEALTMAQLDAIDDKGYIFLHKYAGYAGVFFSKDYACSDGDYNCISRNRVINKSRRMVRRALLPYVNAPIYLSSGGTLSTGDRTAFINIITDVLNTMKTAGEISEIGTVNFDNTTNLLQTKTLLFSYHILPVGCAEMIKVTQGFAVTI